MRDEHQTLLTRLGHRLSINGSHAAGSMLLDDLRQLKSYPSSEASQAYYASAVLEGNGN